MRPLPLRYLWLLLLFLAVAIISYLSLTPVEFPSMLVFKWSDKLIHAAVYFCLTLLVGNLFLRRFYLFLIPLCVVFGSAVEVLQPYAGRHFDWYDMLANATGCILALGLLLLGADKLLSWFSKQIVPTRFHVS